MTDTRIGQQGTQQQGNGQAPPPLWVPQNGQQQGTQQQGAGQAPPQQQNNPPPSHGSGQGQQAANGQQSQGQGQAPPQDVASLPEWAQTLIRNTRDEAAQARTRARDDAAAAAKAEVAQSIAAALGFTPQGQAPDPVKLQQQIVERENQLKIERIDNAAYRAALGLGANPDLLLDSNAFLANAHRLDPAAADFHTQLAATVTNAVTNYPYLKAGTQPGAAPPPQFAPNPAQMAGNGAPPPPATTVQAGADLYAKKHPKSTP